MAFLPFDRRWRKEPERIVHHQPPFQPLAGTPDEWRQWGEGVLCKNNDISPLFSATGITASFFVRAMTRNTRRSTAKPWKGWVERNTVPTVSHHILHPGAWMLQGTDFNPPDPDPELDEIHHDLQEAGLI